MIIFIIYLAGVVLGYLAQRAVFKKEMEWTIGDRKFALLCGFLFSWVNVIVAGIYYLVGIMDDDRKASW